MLKQERAQDLAKFEQELENEIVHPHYLQIRMIA